ncbi:MAG: hypothetical protein JHC95_12350 [Solirubrobacteraceae bacterium]|nr:hypothetical protein [Solirubrobacteraceae bacterium]
MTLPSFTADAACVITPAGPSTILITEGKDLWCCEPCGTGNYPGTHLWCCGDKPCGSAPGPASGWLPTTLRA